MRTDTANNLFSREHRACNALWTDLAGAAAACPDGALARWEKFDLALRHHVALEEDVLFPAVVETAGARAAPLVARLCDEHGTMRAMLKAMADTVHAGDLARVLDQGESLMRLLGPHQALEEAELYPLADRDLGTAWARVHARLIGAT